MPLIRSITILSLALALCPPALALEVVDDRGATLSLEQPARRIVSLAPHITELLFAAGAGEYVVGTVEFSDYPEAARAVPRIGRHNAFDLERILALDPDLVIAWGSGTPRSHVATIREVGLRVFISEPQRIEDIATTLERFAALAGTTQGAQAAAVFRRGMEGLRSRYAERRSLRVFYEIWDAPLMTVNHRHLIDEVIELCGGVNVFADLSSLTPNVSIEAVLAARPEVIIAASGGDGRRWLDAWRDWSSLPAVAAERLYHLEADLLHRATPRLLEGATRLCEVLEQARSAQAGTPPR